MIIEKELEEHLIEVRCHTKEAIREMQESHCPVLNAMHYKRVNRIRYEGYTYPMVYDDIMYFRSTDVKYEWYKTTRPLKYHPKIDLYPKNYHFENLYLLISRYVLFPVLVFINGKFQKWTNILLIRDINNVSFLIVKNNPDYVYDMQTVYIPVENFLYMEDPDEEDINEIIINSRFYMAFDKDGLYVSDPLIYEGELSAIVGFTEIEYFDYDENTKIQQEGDKKYYVVSHKILRNEYIGEASHIAFDTNNKLVSDFDTRSKYIGDNAFLLDDKLANTEFKKIFTFVWKSGNSLYSNMNAISNKNSIFVEKFYNATGKVIEYFSLHKGWLQKKWEDNVKLALKTILDYDQSILNGAYLKRSMIHEESYILGDFVNSYKIPSTRYTCRYHMKKQDLLNNRIMIFIDGLLYSFHHHIKIEGTDFIVPLMNYANYGNADMDVLIFNDVQNSVYDVTISEIEQEIYIPPDINPEYMQLFYHLENDYTNYFDPEYVITPNEFTWEKVNYSLEHIERNKYKIKLYNDKLYGKKFKMVSKRQFRHYQETWGLDKSDFHVYLNEDFNYTYDDDAFMVFVNGRKVSRDHFIITLPGMTRPFTRPCVELSTFLDRGDVVDVFYLPQSIYSAMMKNNHETTQPFSISPKEWNMVEVVKRINGIKRVVKEIRYHPDKDLIYNLSRDLEFFFVNGRKISKKFIADVSAHHVTISKTKSFNNVEILYHIPEFEIIAEMRKEVTKSEYIRTIVKDVFDNYFEKSYNTDDNDFINLIAEKASKFAIIDSINTEEDFNINFAGAIALIGNVIMEHYQPYGITMNKAFPFDIMQQFLPDYRETQHAQYKTEYNPNTGRNEYIYDGMGEPMLEDGSPLNSDNVYKLEIYREAGLLHYDVHNDDIEDQSIPLLFEEELLE